MVSAQYDRFAYLATFDCFVESKRNLGSTLAVSIQYASLRAHYELILACLANPVDVVSHLSLYLFRSISFDFFHHLSSDAVGSLKVFRVTRSTNPAERTETVVEEPIWDKQRFEAAAYSLQATSLYFTCIANGNSKMYRFDGRSC